MKTETGNKTNRTNIVLLSLVILISLATVVYENYQGWSNPYIWSDDSRANMFWLHGLRDKQLFQKDLLTEYSVFYQARGLIWFYKLTHRFINPFIMAKIIPVLVYMLCGIFLYLMGRHLAGPYAGFLFSITFILYPNHLGQFNCGYSRIFAYPGLILFLYFLITRKTINMIWVIPLLSLLYPIAFLISSLTYLFWLIIRIFWKPVEVPRKTLVIHFLSAMFISACFILPRYAVPDKRFGRILNYEETIHNPSAYKNGRNVFLPHTPLYRKVFDELSHPFIIISLIFLLFFRRRRFLDAPLEFWLTILSGLILYQLAYYFLLRFYFPYKYIRYSVPFVLLLIISFGLGELISQIPMRSLKALALIVFLGIGHYFYGDTIYPDVWMQDYSRNAKLYEYLNTLPKDALIAAPPFLADNIPLFAKRKVLLNYEQSLPWYTRYAKIIRNRTEDFFYAYYTDKRQVLKYFIEKYGIDYIIVDETLYRDLGRKRFYINPYDDFIKKQVRKEHFYLKKHLEELSQFRFEKYYVINTRLLL